MPQFEKERESIIAQAEEDLTQEARKRLADYLLPGESVRVIVRIRRRADKVVRTVASVLVIRETARLFDKASSGHSILSLLALWRLEHGEALPGSEVERELGWRSEHNPILYVNQLLRRYGHPELRILPINQAAGKGWKSRKYRLFEIHPRGPS